MVHINNTRDRYQQINKINCLIIGKEKKKKSIMTSYILCRGFCEVANKDKLRDL